MSNGLWPRISFGVIVISFLLVGWGREEGRGAGMGSSRGIYENDGGRKDGWMTTNERRPMSIV